MSLIHETEQEKQMSEAFVNSTFLALSGGFQDAYTYFTREEVFSNAQTGNVVLMSQHFMCGQWMEGLRYLFPILAFAVGVWVAEQIQGRFRYAKRLHWRQGILLLEIIILFVVGFIPTSLDMAATALVSFASTMCIGNLRSGIAALSGYVREHKSSQAEQMLYYFGIIFLFALGAGLGGVMSMHAAIGIRAIWVSCVLLLISFGLMFIDKPKVS